MFKLRRLGVSLSAGLTLAMTFSPLMAGLARAEESSEEATSSIAIVGQMIELSTTEVPTTIVVRDFVEGGEGWTDYTVEITESTELLPARGMAMADWITGDWVAVTGTKNENTEVVTASRVVNQSLNPFQHRGLNGWITQIDLDDSTMTVQWAGEEHVINVTANTKMVVPPTNPATLADFMVGDRVRLRLARDSATENEARIIIALRRGEEIFLKGRTRQFRAELNALSGTEVPAELSVTLLPNPHLRHGDVNNLIGHEGEERVVLVDEHTKLVRRAQGRVELSAFLTGDRLFIVGRANDDGTITAKLIRDDEVSDQTIVGTYGKIVGIDDEEQTFVLTGGRPDIERTVVTTDATVIEGSDGSAMSFDDLEVGDLLRARGTFNEATSVFTAAKIVVKVPDLEELVEDEELEELDDDEDEDGDQAVEIDEVTAREVVEGARMVIDSTQDHIDTWSIEVDTAEASAELDEARVTLFQAEAALTEHDWNSAFEDGWEIFIQTLVASREVNEARQGLEADEDMVSELAEEVAGDIIGVAFIIEVWGEIIDLSEAEEIFSDGGDKYDQAIEAEEDEEWNEAWSFYLEADNLVIDAFILSIEIYLDFFSAGGTP